MIALMKAEWQKLWFLRSTRLYFLTLIFTSLSLGLVFSLTTPTTQGKALSELTGLQVITANLLGIDAGAILLIIFSARTVAYEFSTKLIHVSLAVTPQRVRFFTAKILTFGLLSLGIGVLITALTFGCGQIILFANGRTLLSLSSPGVLQLLAGCALLPIFYCLLTVCLTFLFRSSAGGISCSLGLMLLPALASWFEIFVQRIVLPLLPRAALHSLSGLAEPGTPEALPVWLGLLSLFLWLSIPYLLAAWDFKKRDV